VMRDVWSIGEHQLHDGVSEIMSHRGLPPNAMLVRSTPPERSAIMELARGLLGQSDVPTGFLCRTELQADCLDEMARSLGVADRVQVAVANAPTGRTEPKHTCIAPEIDEVEVGRMIGTMIKTMTEGKPAQPRGRPIAVKLCPAP
jgi:hypothetical protein